ncbi:VOC family protein [Streptosporangium vulgare]|uniref:VOC family protein n=1 Tax=Streptosporangium vulgare TaxID=46190 RepID=A0ABV5TEV0_9ACTN
MAIRFQVTFDCADPDRLARFWAGALHYRLEEAPEGFESWNDYWRAAGLPEEELFDGYDSVVDPDGVGPRLWFQKVPEGKVAKNRLHLDLRANEDREAPAAVRRERVDAEVARLTALGATVANVLTVEGNDDFYGVTMLDPEENEFCVS